MQLSFVSYSSFIVAVFLLSMGMWFLSRSSITCTDVNYTEGMKNSEKIGGGFAITGAIILILVGIAYPLFTLRNPITIGSPSKMF
jgi:hypothetical protein